MNRIRTSSLVATLVSFAALGCGSQEKVCAPDQRICSDACVSLQSDARNCGTCGNVCGAGQGCSAGQCVDCASSGACATEVLAACGNLSQVRAVTAGLTPAGAPFATDAGPIKLAPLGGQFYVANSLSSSVSTITLSPPSSTTGAAALAIPSAPAGFPDLEYLASRGGLLWASNASTNTLVVADPVQKKIVDELALPPGPFGSNPMGIDFVGSKAYLALNGIDGVAVLDVSKVPGIARTKTIDVSSLAPAGASAMPARVLAVGTKVYVSLWGFDPATFAPPPGSHGRLAVIDTSTDTASSTPVDLGSGCLDPGGMALSDSTLWVSCGFHAFNSATVAGGALVPVDVSGSSAVVGTPIALATNAAGSVAICNGRGYAGATESGTMISFDPVSRNKLGSATVCPADPGKASYVSDVICAR